jgi:hypothetical protein
LVLGYESIFVCGKAQIEISARMGLGRMIYGWMGEEGNELKYGSVRKNLIEAFWSQIGIEMSRE